MSIESMRGLALALWAMPQVKFIVAGVLLNVVLAVAGSIRTGEFTFRELGTFLWRQLAPYVLIYGAFAAGSQGTGFEWVATAVFGLIVTAIGSRILDNLKGLGVPIPARLAALVSPASTYLSILSASDIQPATSSTHPEARG